jgi:hypothetical protein
MVKASAVLLLSISRGLGIGIQYIAFCPYTVFLKTYLT